MLRSTSAAAGLSPDIKSDLRSESELLGVRHVDCPNSGKFSSDANKNALRDDQSTAVPIGIIETRKPPGSEIPCSEPKEKQIVIVENLAREYCTKYWDHHTQKDNHVDAHF